MCRVRRWHINESYRTGVGEIQGTHISQRCLLSGLYTVAQGMGPRRCPEGLDDDNKHRDYVRRFLQTQNTGKQEYFDMILARTQQNRKAPQFSYAKENTVFLCKKEVPRGAV